MRNHIPIEMHLGLSYCYYFFVNTIIWWNLGHEPDTTRASFGPTVWTFPMISDLKGKI